MNEFLQPLAVSMGDPSGIGPDIILKTWNQRQNLNPPKFFVAGDLNVLEKRAESLGIDFESMPYTPGSLVSDALPVLHLNCSQIGEAGNPHIDDAAGTISAIDKCVELVMQRKAGGIVTCPINKHVLYKAGFSHPGHTEYLAELGKRHTGKDHMPVMMLAGPKLKTVPVTIHIPLNEVPDTLTTRLIIETSHIAANDLRDKFGVAKPRLAISGLNPHAGENGSIGHEDETIIMPAVQQLKKDGIDAWGPMPADTMFHGAARQTYDVAICMYHDQALIPAKTLGFDDAVNVTLGLPFIRTSPDHGTAYDIAGTGKANASSFIAALEMAHDMVCKAAVSK